MNQEKNLHLSHIEDLAFNGLSGCKSIVDLLSSIYQKNSTVNISQKWDGSPAIVTGIDPGDGKFFVGTKSVFNKNFPAKYKSLDEINNARICDDLRDKLVACFEQLHDVIRTGVFQGDVIFTPKERFEMTIGDRLYEAFQMNTLVYANTGVRISKSVKLGIVFHTEYHGSTTESMVASYSPIDYSLFKKKDSLWLCDPTVDFSSLDRSFNSENLLAMLDDITTSFFGELHTKKSVFNLAVNAMIRLGDDAFDKLANDTHHQFLKNWLSFDYFQKHIDKKLTSRGRNVWKTHRNETLRFITENSANLRKVFLFQSEVTKEKLCLINKLESKNCLSVFLAKKDGSFERTVSEGYVVSNKSTNTVAKVVDRSKFSYANFSKELIKGW